ncbi:MAG: sigma-54 dependent transcriptional regulator [Schleiferiaceae bacterium]|nr:sigma-54 dependent transcriptional regulator [Schleiferiaceae bacterium]MDR9442872.1 sigma-54 dependent transcriptional regulator [Schleiferiaceae bacterium]
MAKILIIEDEKAIRNVLGNILKEEDEKTAIMEAATGKEGLNLLAKQEPELVLCDIKMPGMDGMEVLEAIRERQPDTAVIMISGHGDIDTAVNCMKMGAYDYIAKPPDLNRLIQTVRNALDRRELVQENKTLKKKISKQYQMVGQSAALQEVQELIDKVAPTDARVLITGPNGTGKELVAHGIHQKSERSRKAMVEVNCAAIPAELIESELFGHKKGAFTSAVKDRKGKFETAHQGTLFLDEIGDMSLSAQSKVLRALQEGKITPVGGDKEIKVDVRVLAATNKDLEEEIKQGRFREDLYHRLSVILIRVPALRERTDDIPELATYFAQTIARENGSSPVDFQQNALKALQEMDYPGNIRELRNVVERLLILGSKPITAEDVKRYASK